MRREGITFASQTRDPLLISPSLLLFILFLLPEIQPLWSIFLVADQDGNAKSA